MSFDDIIGQLELSHIPGGSGNWYDHFGKPSDVYTKAEYMYTLGIYATEMRIYI